MPTHVISVETTYSELIALIGGNLLQEGAIYKISDRGDRGLFFTAIASNKLAKDGTRLMLCPARYSSNETDVYGNVWKGVWNNSKTVAANNLMIWGGKVWKNLTGVSGSATDDFTLDATNWQLISKSSFSNHEYVELAFGVQYDVTNDWVERQWDTSGNTFGLDYETYQAIDGTEGGNYCEISDWNYAANNESKRMYNNRVLKVSNNSCGSIYSNSNNKSIYNNTNSGNIYSNSNSGGIYSNSNTNSGHIFNNSNNGDITSNSNAGDISNNSNSGDIDSNSNTGYIISNNNSGDIKLNSNAGNIFLNCNIGYILFNSNTGNIESNSNADVISSNANSGHIKYNSNTGYIGGIASDNTNIQYNKNNGNIETTTTGDISDAQVNK